MTNNEPDEFNFKSWEVSKYKHPSELDDDCSAYNPAVIDQIKTGFGLYTNRLKPYTEGISGTEIVTIAVCAGASIALAGLAIYQEDIISTLDHSKTWLLNGISEFVRY
jgi:hypothetical protein